jgi:ABC-type branched-subunit amino acid transport system ATPase component
MFELDDLHAFYGKSHVVQGVSFRIEPGEAVGLVGRNGVGKTTTLKSIMGMVRQTRGRVVLRGQELGRLAPHARARRGLGYVPEERAVFTTMTVEENLRIGAMLQGGRTEARCLELAYGLFPILQERRQQVAGTLSGGQQKMLALARGLSLQPALLLVDEPSEGLMPLNVQLITQALVRATGDGLSVLVVDASFDLLRATCRRLFVMDRGRLVATYRPDEFATPDQLAATYLGGGG